MKVALDRLDWIGPYWIGREFYTVGETKQIRKWLVLQWGGGVAYSSNCHASQDSNNLLFLANISLYLEKLVTMELMENHT